MTLAPPLDNWIEIEGDLTAVDPTKQQIAAIFEIF